MARLVDELQLMSVPRQVLPGRFYMITRRCTQRQFLLRPDPETNNNFLYCLAEAAARFEIDVLLPSVLSNHHHTVVFDRHGRIVEFVEHFHKMLAKCQNALRGRWENMFSSESVSLVQLVGVQDVIDRLVYAAANWCGLYPVSRGSPLLAQATPVRYLRRAVILDIHQFTRKNPN